ncbi:hypothetical protein AB0K21_22395 [Streptosporangium sp. NPDC049248]|uniref:hypothetical protein n=1 Tax=Streptosporangium sp. NPDC049248 TaxID=3155651 RepID=UPI003428A823
MRFFDTGLVLDHSALNDWLSKDIEIEVIIGEAVRRGYPIVVSAVAAAEASRQALTVPARERLHGLLYLIAQHVDGLDADGALIIGGLAAEREVVSLAAAHTAHSASTRVAEIGNVTDWRIIARDAEPYRRLCPRIPVSWP